MLGTKLILEDEDDDFVSPDLLDLIDVWESECHFTFVFF